MQCLNCGASFVGAENTISFSPDENGPTMVFVPASGANIVSQQSSLGDYAVLEEIAKGGMGVVFKARQQALGRVVALKVIRSGELADLDEVARFKLEAEAVAQLDHPGIVPVYEVGETKGQHFLAMAFVEGGTLADKVAEGPLSPDEAAEFLIQIAEAVQHAHNHGVIHRDLKPRNIMVDGDGRARVTDFGLAKNAHSEADLTLTGQVMGTPGYMAPEQASGGECGPTTDVYALGATLYCLLTARAPFQASTPLETIQQVLEREPPPVRILAPSVPKDLETICLKCLRKDAGKRYESATALRDDIERWSNNEPILARPVGIVEKSWKWCRRHPSIAASITVILLAAIIVAVFTAAERRRLLIQRTRTATNVMSTAQGKAVPFAIDDLKELPRDLVISELRSKFDAGEAGRKLSLAYALAHFEDVRVEVILGHVGTVSENEFANLLAALAKAKHDAIAALKSHRLTAIDEKQWKTNARLAMLALCLGEHSLAENTCRLRADMSQRTWFVEESATWHDDLESILRIAAASNNGPLRSALLEAVANTSIDNAPTSTKQLLRKVASDQFRECRDGLSHSASRWALQRWNFPLPSIPPTASPTNRDWYINTLGMTMLQLKPGRFERTGIRVGTKRFKHSVEITRPFLIADCEVTRAQFQAFIDDPDYPNPDKPKNWGGANLEHSPTGKHPVQRVSWYDAVQFCNWLSHREGIPLAYEKSGEHDSIRGQKFPAWSLIVNSNGYRLPSEAEWEFGCMAGTTTRFSHGNQESLLERFAVYKANGTQPVATKMPNGWGLFDMHGNVYELCHDRFERFASNKTLVDPFGPTSGGACVARSGSFNFFSKVVQTRHRVSQYSNMQSEFCGFRVARSN